MVNKSIAYILSVRDVFDFPDTSRERLACSKFFDDWFLFYERKRAKWFYPIASIAFPLVYVIFLLIQAIILKFDSSFLIVTTTTPLIYPYFFVNLDTQGVYSVFMWVGVLSVAFIVVGYLFLGLDKLHKKKLEK